MRQPEEALEQLTRAITNNARYQEINAVEAGELISYIAWLEGFREGVLTVYEEPGPEVRVLGPEITESDLLNLAAK